MCSAHYLSEIWGSTLPTRFWRWQPTRSVRLRTRSSSQIAEGRPLSSGWSRWKREFSFCFSISFFHFLLRLKGKCKNLAHPAIPAVIHDFFYTDKDCLAAIFRQDFERVVPDHAIALVMTCVSSSTYQTTSANDYFIDSKLPWRICWQRL